MYAYSKVSVSMSITFLSLCLCRVEMLVSHACAHMYMLVVYSLWCVPYFLD